MRYGTQITGDKTSKHNARAMLQRIGDGQMGGAA